MDSQNDSTMQYGHMPLQERRESNLDSNGSTPFQTHQSLGQALGTHLSANYARGGAESYRNPSTSPPTLNQSGASAQNHAGPSGPHPPITFAVTNSQNSPALKRKHVDAHMNAQGHKRRRDPDDPDAYDIDGSGQGAKHWSDEEKTKLFRWLMGSNSDEHWSSLRATKNSCLRECATEVFEGKKTYQALKGCYERNFNLFKQIYAFEASQGHPGPLQAMTEADRLREYERRLQMARKNGCDVGNVTARTIDHWHNRGWYDLFYRRWHGDPATTRPVQVRNSTAGPSNPNAGDDQDDDDQQLDFTDPTLMVNGINGLSHDRSHQVNFINPQSLRDIPTIPPSPATGGGPAPMPMPTPSVGIGSSSGYTGGSNGSGEPNGPTLTITPSMINTCLQYLQVQTQTGKMKLEYMRRREEREEKESQAKQEFERVRLEYEKKEQEQTKQAAVTKQRTDKALELLNRPEVDASVKAAATDYLRRLFVDVDK